MSVAGEPRYAPTILADKISALAISNAISVALLAREKTGRGQFVEIPMFEQLVSFVLAEHLFGHNFVPPMGSLGYTRVTGAWRRPYKTKDGYLCMMAYTERHWRKFWPAVGKPEICDDPRFYSIATRSHNVVALYELAGGACSTKPPTSGSRCCASLKSRARAWRASTICSPIRSSPPPAFSSTPRIRARARSCSRTPPVRFSETPTSTERLQPRLGEHSFEVLREAGLSESEIKALAASGATVDGSVKVEAAE